MVFLGFFWVGFLLPTLPAGRQPGGGEGDQGGVHRDHVAHPLLLLQVVHGPSEPAPVRGVSDQGGTSVVEP